MGRRFKQTWGRREEFPKGSLLLRKEGWHVGIRWMDVEARLQVAQNGHWANK